MPVTWYTDMSACQPRSAFSATMRKGHWRTIDYATADCAGKLVFAGPETRPPALTLRLGLKGWHAIYVRIWGGSLHDPVALKLKLTADPCFRFIEQKVPALEAIEDAFFTYADLTDNDLIIAQTTPVPVKCAGIAYVRFDTLDAGMAALVQEDRRQTATKRLISTNDGGCLSGNPATKEELWEYIEPLADSDYSELHWGIVGDHVPYPTKVARFWGQGQEDFLRIDMRRQAECVQTFIRRGINPLVAAMEHAHAIGLKFHLYQRMGAFAALPPYDETFGSRFYHDHPELRCVMADGRSVMRLSLAYPEVRALHVAIFREAAAFGLDGINVNYKRGAPFVVYEPPLVDGYKRETGLDPRTLDEWDEGWLRYRAGAVTQFMRELRQAMDEVGQRLGRRLEVSATTHPTPQECLIFGLDLKTWIREGLVDNLTPMGFSHGGREVDLAYYCGLTKNTPCRFCPHLPYQKEFRDGKVYDVEPKISTIRDYALRYYEQGAEGLAVWDSGGLDCKTALGPFMRRLGHIDELRADAGRREADDEPNRIRLTRLGDFDMTVRDIPEDNQCIYPHGTPHHGWLGL